MYYSIRASSFSWGWPVPGYPWGRPVPFFGLYVFSYIVCNFYTYLEKRCVGVSLPTSRQ
jgi:hypothetical protein